MSKRETTRRDFLKGLGLGAAACSFGAAAGPWQGFASAGEGSANPFAWHL